MDQFSTRDGPDDTGGGEGAGSSSPLMRRRRSLRVFGIRIGSRRQVIYAAVSLLISIFVNYVFLWPVNHFWALMLFALAVSGVLLNDLPRRQALAGSGGCFAVAGLLYLLIGPAEKADSVWRHFLRPGSAATPANACTSPQHPLPPGAKLVLLGDRAILLHRGQNVVVLTVGACRSVALFQDEDGIILNADDFNDFAFSTTSFASWMGGRPGSSVRVIMAPPPSMPAAGTRCCGSPT